MEGRKSFTGGLALLPERGGGGGFAFVSADSSEEILRRKFIGNSI